MPNGPMRITSGPFEPELYKSEFEVQDGELKVGLKIIIIVIIKLRHGSARLWEVKSGAEFRKG